MSGHGHGHGHGLGGARWTLAKAVGANGIWLPADTGLGLEADPALAGDWAGAHWAGSEKGPYTHTAGVGNTAALTRNILTVGLRYETVFTVSGRTAGSVTWQCGATNGTARSADGTYTEDLTCTTNTAHSFVPTEDFDGVVTVVRVTTLSISSHTPKKATGTLAGSTFVQATPTLMGWSNAGVVLDNASGRIIASNLAASFWKFLHYGDGGGAAHYPIYTVAGAFRMSAFTGLQTLLYSTAGDHGIQSFVSHPAGEMGWYVRTSGGAYIYQQVTAGAAIAPNSTVVFIVRATGARLEIWVDGVKRKDEAFAGSASNNDPGYALRKVSNAVNTGQITWKELFVSDYSVSDSLLSKIGKSIAARHGGTWV